MLVIIIKSWNLRGPLSYIIQAIHVCVHWVTLQAWTIQTEAKTLFPAAILRLLDSWQPPAESHGSLSKWTIWSPPSISDWIVLGSGAGTEGLIIQKTDPEQQIRAASVPAFPSAPFRTVGPPPEERTLVCEVPLFTGAESAHGSWLHMPSACLCSGWPS